MKTVLTLLGTRPEIIKLSPLIPLIREQYRHILVHSGQHYSFEMDELFFTELGLPQPDHTLAVGSATHGEQTARMLARLEPILFAEQPDLVLVQGDTNTTLAGALCAAKLGIPVVHLEAGGRSFNRDMPEELNRIVVDHISALLLAADEIANRNLRNEGLPAERIRVIGSSDIDAVYRNRERAAASDILTRLELATPYLVVTLHRSENTTAEQLPGMLRALGAIATTRPLVFPLHPRTAAAMRQQGLDMPAAIRVCEPLGYLDTLKLVGNAEALLTDSGGLQEEAGALGVPTLILRKETEWRYLVEAGMHVLVGNTETSIRDGAQQWLQPAALERLRAAQAPIWAGASERALAAMQELIG
ncbi:MAG TPA: UDP-N-acetylglucosamine 2-epimerase (non-hydrolyzing) [Roseiflexaceae bacterium]|nr:UDP-N-acetylglucosamine 2-epimerase (non-hydrolyzing) [Roseiflexaceae bacterium]